MKKSTLLIPGFLTLSACFLPVDAAPPPTALASVATQPALIPSPSFAPTPAPTTAPSFCDDPRGRELLTSFTNAIASSNGELLASLVSPSSGMDVRFHRDGEIIHYDAGHAEFVFESTYQADWGLSFGSGEPTIGSFQEVVLPSLEQVFTSKSGIICNQMKTGGATYEPVWPYPNMDFYSVHYAGTDPYGGLD
jgi:hypothetical protein